MKESKFKDIVDDVAERVLMAAPIYQRLDLFEIIEKHEKENNLYLNDEDYELIAKKIKKQLNSYIKYRESKRSESKFKFSKSDEYSIVGIAFKDDRFKSYTAFYNKLTNLDNFLFEKFSAKYINLLMCDFSFVSRASADGGIDFLGKGNFQKLLNINGEELNLKSKDFSFRVVGQSKRYNPKHKIGTKEIREFLGSVKILQEAAHPNKESAWLGETEILNLIKLADPFLYLFVTTSYYSRDSIDLATKLGIYIVDIDDIVFDLITHDIGMSNGGYNSIEFEKWIKK